MNKFNVIALANTFAIIDLVAHPLFHVWVVFSPDSYEWLMNLFVAGLHVEVTAFDYNVGHILFGTVLEAAIFWVLGAAVAIVYNMFARK